MNPIDFARYRGSLRLIIGGAGTLWVVHFALVYLVAEWQCRPNRPSETPTVAGVDVTTIVSLAATLTIGIGIVVLTRAVIGGSTGSHVDPATVGGPRPEVAMTAWVLASIFVIATVVVGLVPLFLESCQ